MKKALYKIKDILKWIFVLISMAVMLFAIIFSVSTFNKVEGSLFGYKAFIVLSNSMSESGINAGDLIIIRETDPSTLKEGDIISYKSTNPENYGQVITHKIRSLAIDENGNLGFITYGTTTGTDDKGIVLYENVIGEYTKSLPKVGHFFAMLKTPMGYIIFIMIPFMVLMILELATFITVLSRYKKEKQDSMIEAKNK